MQSNTATENRSTIEAMQPEPYETNAQWHARMADIAGKLSQDQVDAVQWVLGGRTGGHADSWTPAGLAQAHKAAGIYTNKPTRS